MFFEVYVRLALSENLVPAPLISPTRGYIQRRNLSWQKTDPARLLSPFSRFLRTPRFDTHPLNHRCHISLSGHKIGGQRLLGLLKLVIEGKIESETPRVITLRCAQAVGEDEPCEH